MSTPTVSKKDPMVFGNALIEYQDGNPLNMRGSNFKPVYNPTLADFGLTSNENGEPLFELEDDE